MELATVVNTEMWEIFGPWWRLPVRVQWFDQSDVAAVDFETGIPLLPRQVKVLVSQLSAARFDGQYHWVLRARLEAIGIPTKRPMEEVVIWHPPQGKVSAKSRRDPDLELFLSRLVEAGYFQSVDQADAIRRIFNKAMLDWLLNEKKPVDLMFCTLWPVPYRSNWKQVVFERDLAANPTGAHEITVERIAERISDTMESGEVLMLHRFISEHDKQHGIKPERDRYRIGWTLEVEYAPIWWKMVLAVETRARQMLRNSYALAVRETLRKVKLNSARLYRQFLEQIGRPNADILCTKPADYPYNLRPRERSEDEKVLRGIPAPRDLPDVQARPGKVCRVSVDLSAEAPGLSGVSHLEPNHSDMRNGGEDSLEPNDGARGAGGMLVLDADGGVGQTSVLGSGAGGTGDT